MAEVEEQEQDSGNPLPPVPFDFDTGVQRKIATLILRDTNFAMRAKDLVEPEYFSEDAVGTLVGIVKRHLSTYKAVPDIKIIKSLIKDELDAKRLRPDMKDEVVKVIKDAYHTDLTNHGYALDKVRNFARRQAMENAMARSIPALDKGDFASIEKAMKEALAVGTIVESQDYDYYAEIVNRTKRREDFNAGRLVKNGITTGYSGIDCYLYHNGWGRKELSLLMGAAKAGKSLGLGDFTKNASLAGYNVFYGSLEVASWIIAERLDASIADTLMRELHKDPKLVEARIQAAQAKSGKKFKMRDFPSGTLKVSHLYRVLEDYRADGIIFDLITVDYADIMAAEYRNDQLRDNLREIYIDLRALAFDFDAALLTATQTNRDGAKAVTAKATDVGDDWNKVRTADIIIGINANDADKKAGKCRLYWAASRNTEDGFTIEIAQDRQKMQFLTRVLGKM